MRLRGRVLTAINFFPRGGSAHVCRALSHQLGVLGWDVTIVSGSRSDLGSTGDATRFYAGLDVRPVDFTDALSSPDPLAAPVPLHPSFEDRPGALDRVFAELDDAAHQHQVRAWADALDRAGAAAADVLYLHHLTSLHDAAELVAPDVPVVCHLHGTELLMLERIESGAGWPFGERWAERLREWADRCERLCVGPGGLERAQELLGIEPDRLVEMPNGFDPTVFTPRPVRREAVWRRLLVDEPRGWRPGSPPGSVRYAERDLAAFADGNPVLLYVGRFTEVKRVDLLIRAYARARDRFARRAPLVLVGGYPGEWEGEHPVELAERLGVPDVFHAGWHDQPELPDILCAADALVLPSVREQFGQVLVEAMACERPPIAVDTYGPATIVDPGHTGWLVPPDDEPALADALVEVVNDPAERARRGTAARTTALARYAWPAVSARLDTTLRTSTESMHPQPTHSRGQTPAVH